MVISLIRVEYSGKYVVSPWVPTAPHIEDAINTGQLDIAKSLNGVFRYQDDCIVSVDNYTSLLKSPHFIFSLSV